MLAAKTFQAVQIPIAWRAISFSYFCLEQKNGTFVNQLLASLEIMLITPLNADKQNRVLR